MMRIAAIAATEAGIEVCAPVHDAFLISAPISRIDEDVAKMREIMAKAGRLVTGIDVRTDVKVVRSPDRYMDDAAPLCGIRSRDCSSRWSVALVIHRRPARSTDEHPSVARASTRYLYILIYNS